MSRPRNREQAAKSPYDLAMYIGSHRDIDWPALLRAMGATTPLPEYLPQCVDQGSCQVELITVAQPSHVIVVISNLLHFYFRFLKQRSGWRFAGYYRPDYVIASHELGQLGLEPILRVTEEPRGGTGLAMEVQRMV